MFSPLLIIGHRTQKHFHAKALSSRRKSLAADLFPEDSGYHRDAAQGTDYG